MTLINTTNLLGSLERVSPSQLTDYGGPTGCERRWYFTSACKNSTEQSPQMEVGEGGHSIIEGYFDGKPVGSFIPDKLARHPTAVDTVVDSIKQLLLDERIPKPGEPGLQIEEPRNFELGFSLEGVRLRGRIDLQQVHPATLSLGLCLDWKSSGNLQYAKDEDELARDIQVVTYAKSLFARHETLELVRVGHGYFKTKDGSGARLVLTDPMDRDHVERFMTSAIAPTIREMKDVAKETDFTKVDVSGYRHCFAYNRRCAFKDTCDAAKAADAQHAEDFAELSATPTPVTNEVTTTMSLKEKLAAANAASATGSATPPPVRATGINPPDAPPPKPVAQYVADAAPPQLSGSAQALLQSQAAVAGFFMVYQPDATTPPKQRFMFRHEAIEVAEKMAKEHGKPYFVLHAVSKTEPVAAPVTTTVFPW